MKKSFVKSLIPTTFVLVLLGCNNDSEQTFEGKEFVNIYEMYSFSDINNGNVRIISESNDINNIKDSVSSAIKISGVVDVADPQYKVEMGEESYFLWVSEQSGTIMNVKDTHTVYKLSDSSVKKINELITSKFKNP